MHMLTGHCGRVSLCLSALLRYPEDAWELMWGYDQDRFMGSRAGAALVAHIKAADALMKEDTDKQLQDTEGNRQ